MLAGQDDADGRLADVAAAPGADSAMISSKEVSSRTRIASNSSWRQSSKCSQRAATASTPDFVSSVSSSFLSIGTHEPHWVPARVQLFRSPSSVQPSPSQAPQPLTVSRMVPAVTLLQEHTRASSGSSSPAGAAAGRREVCAGLARQFAAQQRAQRGVGGRVADEDAAEQGLGVVGDDDLLVDAACRVGVDDFEGVLGPGERVTEARDVHAGQLQLRRVVDAR